MVRVLFCLMAVGRINSAVMPILLISPLSGGANPASSSALLIPEVKADKRICFAMYTVHRGVLKLTAQLYPIPSGIDRDVYLDVRRGGNWKQVGCEKASPDGWAATFRVENWDASGDVPYRVRHGRVAEYLGIVRRDPAAKETIVVAAFSGNAPPLGDGPEIPKSDILANIKKLKPDLLFFAGGQVCAHENHLAHWLRFGREFGEVLRECPAVCLPDADDVGQDRLWGAGGKRSEKESGEDGGYYRPMAYVRDVERAQLGHLPDPHDGAPLPCGLGVYHTALTLGRVSFAILDGRKFKSAPVGVMPRAGTRPGCVMTNAYDPAALDVPGAELLGERQLSFLRGWVADWDDCDMKAVLSQAAFCGIAQLYGARDQRVYADLDSNGWPKSARDRALEGIRPAFAVQIAGGGHLGYVVHQGIESWNDACFTFGVPPMVNGELRWWAPEAPANNRPPGVPEYGGEFLDGFGNRMTVLAVANPPEEPGPGGAATTRAAGFGVIRFHKPTREVTFECWPRNVDIGSRDARQYPGWPIKIRQEENNQRKPTGHLGTLTIKGAEDPLVEVVDDASGEVLYALRIKGTTYNLGVFRDGPHTVNVVAGKKRKSFPGVLPVRSGGPAQLEADFLPPPPPEPEKPEPKKRGRPKG